MNLKEKYKGTKFPTESNFVARSKILMFRFQQRKHMYLRQNAIIQPTISQFKIVPDFFERCHLKAHFSCFRILYLFYHRKYFCA